MTRATPGAEATRTLLVALGELEQGVLDAAPITPVEPAHWKVIEKMLA